MLYSGFVTLHRSVIRRQTGFAARITRTLSCSEQTIHMKSLLQFSTFHLLLFAAICALFLLLNLSSRVEQFNLHFSTPYLSQTIKRGWPLTYQLEKDGYQYHAYASIDETEREKQRARFVNCTPNRITSSLALCLNLAVLFTLLAGIHFAIAFILTFRTSQRQDIAG